jgi:hypothetical protein
MIIFRKIVTVYMIAALLCITTAQSALAGFSPSISTSTSSDIRAKHLMSIRAELEKDAVAQRLADLGFSFDEVNSRLENLSDEQLHKFAMDLDQLRTGGDAIATLVGAALFVFLVILILDLTGKTSYIIKN